MFDSQGRWVGVVSHKLGDLFSLRNTGQTPQGYNFAVKNSLAWPLFDVVAGARMPVEEHGKEAPLEELVKRLSGSVVLVVAE